MYGPFVPIYGSFVDNNRDFVEFKVFLDFMKLDQYKGLEQIVLWVFIYLFVFDYHFDVDNWGEAMWYTLVEVATYMFVFYLNYLVLIPSLLKPKRHVLYALSLVALLLVYVLGIRYSGLEQSLYEYVSWRNVFSMCLNGSLFLLLSTLYGYYQAWQQEKERQLKLKAEKLESELKFLRTQVSPHFLFNSLNNLYSLSLQKHDNAAPMVAKLSNIMRYILYDCKENSIPLEKELEYLQEYIDLQLLRLPASDNVDLYIEGNFKGIEIAPLLLINFVENCFKHSDLNENEDAWIRVSLVREDNILHFDTQNSFVSQQSQALQSGIGLKNAQRQLELNYPNEHKLDIETQDGVFEVKLKIELK